MRLLRYGGNGKISLEEFPPSDVPRYAVLSHTWGADEVTFDGLKNGESNKSGYEKIAFCGRQASKDGLQYFWVDTCCIDKSSSAELQEAINSMFRWYRDAAACYVYLVDVSTAAASADGTIQPPWETAFRSSRWFTRGWTLQELIAPTVVKFFSKEGNFLGDKTSLEQCVCEVTGLPARILRASRYLSQFSIDERMAWMQGRQTTREEDMAYSLLGIFNVFMPLLYGEGRAKALKRLREHIYRDADAPADRPDRSNRIPSYPLYSVQPIKNHVHRTSLCDQIREQFCRDTDPHRQGETKKVGIWGSGGVGKSQLALSYLQRFSREYDATFWVQAGEPVLIDRDYLEIYKSLPGSAQAQSQPTTEDVKRAILAWFASSKGRWLMVFDGADYLDTRDGSFVDLPRYIPRCPTMHIIITSRSSTAGRLSTFEGVRVGQLEESQAVDLFFRCAELPKTEEATVGVENIVREFGCLALAIAIAGNYVQEMAFQAKDLPEFLDDFRRRRQELLREVPDELINNYNHSVMTVWETSYQAVHIQRPDACRVLMLMAFFNYDDIFLELLNLGSRPDLTVRVSSLPSTSQDFLQIHAFKKSLVVLEKYSLLQRNQETVSYSMHKLLHAWSYDRLEYNERRHICYYGLLAVRLLCQAVLDCDNSPKAKARLLPHLRHNSELVRRLQGFSEKENMDLCDCLELFAIFVADVGNWDVAAVLHADVLERRQRVLGSEHDDTITAMGNLARSLRSLGKLDEAATIQRQLLQKRRQALGDENTKTITAMYDLSGTLCDQAKLNEAAVLGGLVMGMRAASLGDEHEDTLAAATNLAVILHDQGRLDEAAILHNQVIETQRRVFGDGHPFMITAMHNFATLLREQGKFDEAAVIQTKVLEERRKLLGDKHPDTLSAMSNLAIISAGQGNIDESTAMAKDVLKYTREVFGHERPETLAAMHNLSLRLTDQGMESKAAEMASEVADKQSRMFGEDHPLTLTARANFAFILGRQGKVDDALALVLQVFDKRRAVLGEKHPETIKAAKYLVHTACQHDKVKMVKLLLERDMDLRSPNSKGWTQLYGASVRGQVDLVKLLLESGATVDSTNKEGCTPLNAACDKGHTEIVRILLEAHADVTIASNSGCTPLYTACFRGDVEMVKLLFQRGANPGTVNNHGWTALGSAASNGHIRVVELLLEEGADPTIGTNNGWTPLHAASISGHTGVVKLLLEKGVSPEAKSELGLTPLMCAIDSGHDGVVEVLLTHKADANTTDSSGRAALSYAARFGRNKVAETLVSAGMAALDQKDRYGSTPLSIAVRHGNADAVRLLLRTGQADIQSRDCFGRTPLWYARMCQHDAVAQQLLEHAEAKGIISPCEHDSPKVRLSAHSESRIHCDICTLGILETDSFYHCKICQAGEFDICLLCFELGGRCLGASHELVQANNSENSKE